jgi:hypothetical protein
MDVSPIQINVNRIERTLFETAARSRGMTVTELVKEAVLTYVQQTLTGDEFAEARARWKTAVPTRTPMKRYHAVAGKLGHETKPGSNNRESLGLRERLGRREKRG